MYAVGESDGQPYLCMKYVEGTTLARRVADNPLPPVEAVRYLLRICRAVQYAHDQGILHRDLKPSNVLIDRKDQPYVTDFGLAKQVEGGPSLTTPEAILGTPSYMPPEQACGSRGRLSPASDVYSLGAILYELLTGRPPFRAATPVETLLLVLDQEPVPPRQLNAQVDRALELICLKCLQKQPDLRIRRPLPWPMTWSGSCTAKLRRCGRAPSPTWSTPSVARRPMRPCWRTGVCYGCGTA